MSVFHFKEFSIEQSNAALKVGTDSMLLGAFAKFESPNTILDIGTGTGVLSLMMAQKYPESKITALEIDKTAFSCARENFENNSLGKNCTCIHSALQDFETEKSFDAIISNPPYFEASLKNVNEKKAYARHTDLLSYSDLIKGIRKLLSKEGICWIICPTESLIKIEELISLNKLFLRQRIQIESKKGVPVRYVLCFGVLTNGIEETSFIIRNSNNSYSDEYVHLTKSFHNKEINQKSFPSK